jgi:soluble lytic murein transglycosylase
MWEPAQVTLLLDDPRLAAVKAETDHEAYARAAQALSAAMIATPGPTAEEKPAWLYQLGRLRALGGDPTGAAKAFTESAAAPWPLADHAHVQAAEWLVGVSQFDDALAEAKLVTADPALAGELDLVTADALLGKRDLDGAAAHYRSYLALGHHPGQWVSVALRFAGALLQRPSAKHAEEALALAQRVQFEAPGGMGAGNATDLEKQALATLPFARRKALEHPDLEEMVSRAKSLLASQQTREAERVTAGLLKLKKLKKPSEVACEAWLTHAEALGKLRKKPEAAEAYGTAIERCAGQGRRVDALFAGGRAAAQAGRGVEAIQRYALLEKEFPTHRLADDARLHEAHAALDTGDRARFVDLLTRMPDDYPAGDMVTDGLFELALESIASRHWAEAIPTLERALARSPIERTYSAAGRLPYFLGRALLETGAASRGAAMLAGVIKDHPLSYYMALSYARLVDRDRDAADHALRAAVEREPTGSFGLPKAAWQTDPAFVRAVELARQGDAKLCRAELDRLGVGAHTAPPDLALASAFLLARAGAISPSHGILRAASGASEPKPMDEAADWLAHYPVGRWRAPWEIAYPRPFGDLVAAEAKRSSIPEALPYAIMREESAFEPHVASAAKAYGLMQLIVPTAKKMAEPLGLPWDEESLKRPEVNIALGCRYLAFLRGQFPDNPLLAIPGYNAGDGAPKKWLSERPDDDFDVWVERIPYEETRLYTKRVMTSLTAYEFLYTPDQPSQALRTPLPASPSARAAVATAAPAAP